MQFSARVLAKDAQGPGFHLHRYRLRKRKRRSGKVLGGKEALSESVKSG